MIDSARLRSLISHPHAGSIVDNFERFTADANAARLLLPVAGWRADEARFEEAAAFFSPRGRVRLSILHDGRLRAYGTHVYRGIAILAEIDREIWDAVTDIDCEPHTTI
jgi:hypothetical protein